jgi:hypothetical protein
VFPKHLALAENLRLGLANRIECLIAVPHLLIELNAESPRVAEDVAVLRELPRNLRVFNASARRGAHLRKIAGVILRNILVRDPHRRALLIEVGIVEIGLREGAANRLRPGVR